MEQALKLVEITKQAEAIVEAKAPPATLPELPADLRKCLAASKVPAAKQKAGIQKKDKGGQKAAQKGKGSEGTQDAITPGQPKSPSADTLVLARLEAARKRDACARSLLKWYEQQAKPKVVAAK